jgi:hypothetical protein
MGDLISPLVYLSCPLPGLFVNKQRGYYQEISLGPIPVAHSTACLCA